MSDGTAPDNAAFDRTAGAQRWGEGSPQRGKAKSLKPLMGLIPYVKRQRTTATLAIIFLFVAAALNLAITFPARWLADNGFSGPAGLDPGAVNAGFLAIMLIALFLALFVEHTFVAKDILGTAEGHKSATRLTTWILLA